MDESERQETEIDRDTSKDYRVRNDALREIVDEWRDRARYNRNVGQRHDANQIEKCANELEELIDDA